jgi:hypothetical protein
MRYLKFLIDGSSPGLWIEVQSLVYGRNGPIEVMDKPNKAALFNGKKDTPAIMRFTFGALPWVIFSIKFGK